jgi:hypothetical protein
MLTFFGLLLRFIYDLIVVTNIGSIAAILIYNKFCNRHVTQI